MMQHRMGHIVNHLAIDANRMNNYSCFPFKTYHKRVNHSTTDNMLAVPVSFHVYAMKCRPSLHQKLGY